MSCEIIKKKVINKNKRWFFLDVFCVTIKTFHSYPNCREMSELELLKEF
jgi:hypothetical protein